MGGVGVPTAHTTRMCGRHGRWQRGHGTGARARHAGPERQSHTRRALPDMHAGTARSTDAHARCAVRVGQQRRQGPWATTGRTQWAREGHGARGRRGLKMRARSGDGGDASGAGVRGAGQGRAQAQPTGKPRAQRGGGSKAGDEDGPRGRARRRCVGDDGARVRERGGGGGGMQRRRGSQGTQEMRTPAAVPQGQ